MNSTFKDLESTGNIYLIKKMTIRRSLFQYYRMAELLSKMENAYGQETEHYLKPSILRHFPIRRLPQYNFKYENSSKFPLNINAISNDVDFENCLLIKNDFLNNMRDIYRSLIEVNKTTINILKP